MMSCCVHITHLFFYQKEGEKVAKGSYILRASKTKPDAPFSLSVKQADKVSHIRIKKQNNKFSVMVSNKEIESNGTEIPPFIKMISSLLNLSTPLQANPYSSVFRKKDETETSNVDPYLLQ